MALLYGQGLPRDRLGLALLILVVTGVVVGSIALLALSGNPPLTDRAPVLLVTGDGVFTGEAVVVHAAGDEIVARVPRDVARGSGNLILLLPGDGVVRVYTAEWRGSPLGLPWLAKLSLAGEAPLRFNAEGCTMSLEVSGSYSTSKDLLLAMVSVDGPDKGQLAVSLQPGAALRGSFLVTIDGVPVELEGPKLELAREGLRGAHDAPAYIAVEARVLVVKGVLKGSCGEADFGLAVLEPMKAYVERGVPEPGALHSPTVKEDCQAVRVEKAGDRVASLSVQDPEALYSIIVEVGGEQMTFGAVVRAEKASFVAGITAGEPGQRVVCKLVDPLGRELPVLREVVVAGPEGLHGGG